MTRCENIILDSIRALNNEHKLFSPGEKILLGISGGKDSMTLLKCLSHFDLEIHSIFVDFFNTDDHGIREYAVQYSDYQHVSSTYLESYRQRKNLCFSCAKQRRRVLVENAARMGITKIALGHHKNDVVETLLLNQLFSRETATLKPVQELFRGQFFIIRPLFSVREDLIRAFAKENEFKVTPAKCGAEDRSKRKMIRELLKDLNETHPGIDIVDNLFAACHNVNTEFLP